MKSIFRRKFSISYILLFLLIMLISLILFRKIAMLLLLIMITALFTYLNYYARFPFDISPVLFLTLIVAREYSFLASVFFVLLSGITPMVLAGGSFDHTTLFYLAVIITAAFLSSMLIALPAVLVFLALAVLHHITAFIGSISFGNNPQKEIINFILKILVDGLYILTFSEVLLSII